MEKTTQIKEQQKNTKLIMKDLAFTIILIINIMSAID
jgi:hypothetical protein